MTKDPSTGVIILEMGKLCLQFIGAVFVARIAVTWALNRYKSEKVWESRLKAYVDLVAALGERRIIVGRWIDELERRTSVSQISRETIKRYDEARQKTDESLAAGRLLLPSRAVKLIENLESDLNKCRLGRDQYDDLRGEYQVLGNFQKLIVDQGRKALGGDLRSPKDLGEYDKF